MNNKFILPSSYGKAQTEIWVREVVRAIGSKFHLGIPASSYGLDALTAHDLETSLDKAYEILGADELYRIAQDEVKRLSNADEN